MKSQFAMSFVLVMGSAFAGAQDVSENSLPAASTHSMQSVLLSPDIPMWAGVETLATLYQGLAAAEDKILPLRWGDELGSGRKAGGVAARLAKLGLVDLPLAHLAVVAAHEHLGHGARYREFDVPNVHYEVELPPPYGGGGGEASVNLDPDQLTDDEVLAIWIGGVESHQLLSRTLALQWAARRSVSYQDAALYFQSWRITQEWIHGTRRHVEPGQQQSDLNAWVRLVNEMAGVAADEPPRLSVGDVQSRAKLNLVSPMLFASVFTMLKTYVWDGRSEGRLPMIPIGSLRYLPAARIGLTPFGVDYHLENYLRTEARTILIDLRVGDSALRSSWGGAGVQVANLVETKRLALDAGLDVWKQPGLRLTGSEEEISGEGLGAAATLRGYWHPARWSSPLSLTLELGYKTAGYLEGRPLDATPHVALGVAFHR